MLFRSHRSKAKLRKIAGEVLDGSKKDDYAKREAIDATLFLCSAKNKKTVI